MWEPGGRVLVPVPDEEEVVPERRMEVGIESQSQVWRPGEYQVTVPDEELEVDTGSRGSQRKSIL